MYTTPCIFASAACKYLVSAAARFGWHTALGAAVNAIYINLRRNCDSLLQLQSSIGTTIDSSSGIWHAALAQLASATPGLDINDNNIRSNNGTAETQATRTTVRASAIFKIVQARPELLLQQLSQAFSRPTKEPGEHVVPIAAMMTDSDSCLPWLCRRPPPTTPELYLIKYIDMPQPHLFKTRVVDCISCIPIVRTAPQLTLYYTKLVSYIPFLNHSCLFVVVVGGVIG
jgi:hypothetical protein